MSRLFDATVLPGDALLFKDDIALAFVYPAAEVPAGELVIEPPSYPEEPIADIKAPRKGACWASLYSLRPKCFFLRIRSRRMLCENVLLDALRYLFSRD